MQDNIIKLMPSIKVTPIDSTGAGDIFHGAFTYCIAKGYDIEKTLKYLILQLVYQLLKLVVEFSFST